MKRRLVTALLLASLGTASAQALDATRQASHHQVLAGIADNTAASSGARDGAGQLACNPQGSQVQLNACAADELAAADAQLNVLYQQVMAALADAPLARQNLRAAQRHWIAQRDADLLALFPLAQGQDPRAEYGSMYPMRHALAKAAMTRARSAWLHTHFIDTDG